MNRWIILLDALFNAILLKDLLSNYNKSILELILESIEGLVTSPVGQFSNLSHHEFVDIFNWFDERKELLKPAYPGTSADKSYWRNVLDIILFNSGHPPRMTLSQCKNEKVLFIRQHENEILQEVIGEYFLPEPEIAEMAGD